MDISTIIMGSISAVSTGLLSLIWLDIRSIRQEVAQQTDKYHACQKELPLIYANKFETKNDINKLWERTDKHSDDIHFLKGQRESTH